MITMDWFQYDWYRMIAYKSIGFIIVYIIMAFLLSKKSNNKSIIRRWSISLLIIINFTLLFRYRFANVGISLNIGKVIERIVNEHSIKALLELVFNILIFIPFGYYSKTLFNCKLLYLCMILFTPIVIEVFQLAFKIGFFELDDIILNIIGSVIGLLICLIKKNKERYL